MIKNFYTLFIITSFIMIFNSCSQKLEFKNYFDDIKNSGLTSKIKNIQYYGPLRYKNQNVRFLMTDSIYSSYTDKKINFIDIDTSKFKNSIKIDTTSILNTFLLLDDYEKKFFIFDIEQSKFVLRIFFDLNKFNKKTLPTMTSDYFEKNESGMKTGVLEKVLVDSSTVEYKNQIMEGSAKLSDGWYFYYLKE